MDPHFRRSVTVCLAPRLTSAEFLKEMTIAIRNDDSMSTKVASDLFNGKVAPQTLIELAKMLTDSAARCELIAACAVKLTRTEVYQAYAMIVDSIPSIVRAAALVSLHPFLDTVDQENSIAEVHRTLMNPELGTPEFAFIQQFVGVSSSSQRNELFLNAISLSNASARRIRLAALASTLLRDQLAIALQSVQSIDNDYAVSRRTHLLAQIALHQSRDTCRTLDRLLATVSKVDRTSSILGRMFVEVLPLFPSTRLPEAATIAQTFTDGGSRAMAFAAIAHRVTGSERAAAVSEALIAEQETIRVKGSVSDLGTFCRG